VKPAPLRSNQVAIFAKKTRKSDKTVVNSPQHRLDESFFGGLICLDTASCRDAIERPARGCVAAKTQQWDVVKMLVSRNRLGTYFGGCANTSRPSRQGCRYLSTMPQQIMAAY
jgi:hypothetical protein